MCAKRRMLCRAATVRERLTRWEPVRFLTGAARKGVPIHALRLIAIALGWLLLLFFTVRVAVLGGIEAGVREFQSAYVVGCAGYLLLLWVVRGSRGRPVPGRWRWWLMGCLALRASLLLTEPSDDTYRYIWEGRVQAAGFNPYVHPPDDPLLAGLRDERWSKINHPSYRAIYPPLAQLEFRTIAAIHPTVRVIKCWHALCDGLVVAVLGALLRKRGRRPHEAVVYGLCPLVLTSFAIEGHLDAPMLLLTCGSVWAVAARREKLAGALLGAAIATKLVLVVLLPWFVIRHRRAAGLAVVVLVACYLPFIGAGSKLFASLVRFSGSGALLSLPSALGLTTYESPFARIIGAGLLGLIVVLLAWRQRPYTTYCRGAIGALLMLMPIVHFWYCSWALLFTALTRGTRWIVASLAFVVYFEATFAKAVTGTWLMPSWVGPTLWLPILAAWGFDAWHARRGRMKDGCHGSA